MATRLLSQFRPIGAVGNNLTDPSLDPAPGTRELQIAPPNYAPGTTNGLIDAPNPRTLSNAISGASSANGQNAGTADPTASAFLYAFGQFVDHDLDLESVGTTDISIPVPDGDPDDPNGTTIPLTRAITDPKTGTAINTVAGYLDLSQVYGSDPAQAASLRNANGTLKTSADNALPIVNGSFVSGDVRATENPELTVITTLFAREHNYWVGILATQNPTWTGGQLYNMAKAIATAEYQNIIYSEYLPALLGPTVMGKYTGYNPNVNPQVTQEFSTAAFRVGHSQVSDEQTGINNVGNVTFMQSLADSFGNTPTQTEANDGINSLLRNLSSDHSQAVDVYAVNGLRNLLADSPDQMDLIAIDIQRERDLGLGTLNQTREALGLPAYTSFRQLTSDPTVGANLQAQFGSIGNVDLFIGGLAENHAPGADVGQTFQSIIARQFEALRSGDRFFWQNEGFDSQTARTIAQTTLGDILERDASTPAEQQNVFIATERHSSADAATDPDAPQLVIGVDTDGATIAGGPGDDTIVSGLGANQTLIGGGGNDVFQFNGRGHDATISDWNGNDTMQFQPTETGAALTALLANSSVTVRDFTGGCSVGFDGNTVRLAGTEATSLTMTNFLFPPGSDAHIQVDGHMIR
jgi:peroxidase